MVSVVAARYAKALADVVVLGDGLDAAQVLAQLRAVQELIESSADLRNALASPAVAPVRKRAVLRRLLEPMQVFRQVRNFAFIISDHRRLHELDAIIEAFERRMDDRLRKFIRADISSAREMGSAKQKSALEAQLSAPARAARQGCDGRFTTDPSLLAGPGDGEGWLDGLRRRAPATSLEQLKG